MTNKSESNIQIKPTVSSIDYLKQPPAPSLHTLINVTEFFVSLLSRSLTGLVLSRFLLVDF